MPAPEDFTTTDPVAEPPLPAGSWRSYHRVTRTATYSFLMALPLLLLYEGLILLFNQGQTMQVRISAEVWMKWIFSLFGAAGVHVLAAIVLVVGIGIFWVERRKNVPLSPRYFGWMVAESAMYAVLLALMVSTVVGMIFAMAPTATSSSLMAPQMAGGGLGMQLALSIGAGLYEELLFRVLLVGGLYLGLKGLFPETSPYAYIIVALVGALLFSAVHYIGALGDAFTLSSFTFRFLFGLALNAVFLIRGFGVAAWTHALYDVMIVTGFLG